MRESGGQSRRLGGSRSRQIRTRKSAGVQRGRQRLPSTRGRRGPGHLPDRGLCSRSPMRSSGSRVIRPSGGRDASQAEPNWERPYVFGARERAPTLWQRNTFVLISFATSMSLFLTRSFGRPRHRRTCPSEISNSRLDGTLNKSRHFRTSAGYLSV